MGGRGRNSRAAETKQSQSRPQIGSQRTAAVHGGQILTHSLRHPPSARKCSQSHNAGRHSQNQRMRPVSHDSQQRQKLRQINRFLELVDDCLKFVEREIRRGNHYDAIIMDPPSYGRGPKGETWKIEDQIYDLISRCREILSEDAIFFLLNSYTTGLQPAVLTYLLSSILVPHLGGKVSADEVGLPVSETSLILPAGAAGRWEK